MKITNPALTGQKLKIAKIAKKFHLKMVIIFGSFVRTTTLLILKWKRI